MPRIPAAAPLGRALFCAVLAAGLAAADGPYAGEMLRWMDCTLPPDAYIVTHAQRRAGPEAPWEAVIPDTQCFRSKVVPEWRVVLWRKDHMTADYYGELFTYDDAVVRLHTETYPAPAPVDPPGAVWDARPDRFRLFVAEDDAGGWRTGRVIAPLDASPAWRHAGRFDTFVCASWEAFERRAAPKWQAGFLDNAVFLERMAPFSTVFDGPPPEGYTADPAFTAFDEAVVVHQCMQRDAGRERFFFARRGAAHYGIVRWDNAVKRDGEWVVTDRTVGLRVGSQPPVFSFNGLLDRARRTVEKGTPR